MTPSHCFETYQGYYKFCHSMYTGICIANAIKQTNQVSCLWRETCTLKVILTLSCSDAQISHFFYCVLVFVLNYTLQ